MKKQFLTVISILTLTMVFSTAANASQLYMVRENYRGWSGNIGGITTQSNDVFSYDTDTGSASMVFRGSDYWDTNNDIDALQVMADGTILFSTRKDFSIGDQTFDDGDILSYNSSTNEVSVLLAMEDLFNDSEDIDAMTMLPNGNLLISTLGDAQIGDLAFKDGDAVEYNLSTGDASVWLTEEEVDGFDISTMCLLEDGTFLFGHYTSNTDYQMTAGGVTFTSADILAYDPGTGAISMYWDARGELDGNSDINPICAISAAPVPVPGRYGCWGPGF